MIIYKISQKLQVKLYNYKHFPFNKKYSSVTFLNQARAWFLKITSVRMCVCVCVRPRAIKNYSREMKSE